MGNLPPTPTDTCCPQWCRGDYDDHDGIIVNGHEGARRTVGGVSALLFADDTTAGPMVMLGVTEGGPAHVSVDLPLSQVRRVIDVLTGLLVDASGVTS